MRILIDECLNWRLGRALTGHYGVSVQKMGWSGIKNGALLALAEREFDVFLTGDRNLSLQQDVARYAIAIVALHASSTQLHHAAIDRKNARGLALAQTRPSDGCIPIRTCH